MWSVVAGVVFPPPVFGGSTRAEGKGEGVGGCWLTVRWWVVAPSARPASPSGHFPHVWGREVWVLVRLTSFGSLG